MWAVWFGGHPSMIADFSVCMGREWVWGSLEASPKMPYRYIISGVFTEVWECYLRSRKITYVSLNTVHIPSGFMYNTSIYLMQILRKFSQVFNHLESRRVLNCPWGLLKQSVLSLRSITIDYDSWCLPSDQTLRLNGISQNCRIVEVGRKR